MNSIISFTTIFLALTFAVIYCDRKYCMLKDSSLAKQQPYSWARVQLAWWSVIVMSSFVAAMIKYGIAPMLNQSTLILIGISAATIATARAIDISDEKDPEIARHQDKKGAGLLIDIISDQGGPSIHRFQTVVFNIIFGAYFIVYVLNNLKSGMPCQVYVDKELMGHILKVCTDQKQDFIMPVIETNNLILLGLSSATYAALKLTENKTEDKKLKKENAEDVGTVNVISDDPAVG